MFQKSSDKIGDEKGPYKFDIDLENEMMIGGWTSTKLSTDPNDKAYKLELGDPWINFGNHQLLVEIGNLELIETLEFSATIGYGATEYRWFLCVG